MAISTTREALSRIFYQRCFWLFALLLTLIGAVSFVPVNDSGRLVLNVVNTFLVIATVAAVGRTTLSFVIVLLLAIPAMWFQYVGLWHDDDRRLAASWMFNVVLYLITVVYLLRYVFRPKIMTPDKLFGAAAAYLLIGVLWAYIYASIGYFYPNSYMVVGQPGRLVYADAVYFSITVLTSTGFGDITPLTRPARGMCMVEQITGSLFVAILIARLAGVYPRARVLPTTNHMSIKRIAPGHPTSRCRRSVQMAKSTRFAVAPALERLKHIIKQPVRDFE
jgi:hypothetical protein